MKSIKLFFLILIVLLTSCRQESKEPQDNGLSRYKDQLIATGQQCYDRGLYWGTGGDISVRIPGSGEYIIKGTGYCVGKLDYDKMAVMNLSGEHLNGPAPSHETPIHTEIYNMRNDVGAILHMHSPYATAFAATGQTAPPVTQQSVSLLKKSGIVPYYPVGTDELEDNVVKFYKDPEITAVFMENHGVFVVGKNLEDLLYKSEVIENTARIAYLAKALGEPVKFNTDEND